MAKLAAVPKWLAAHVNEDVVSGTADTGVGLGSWVGYQGGQTAITLDGEFTAAQLRALAAMMDANRG